ncbi:MAG: WhiB family transcriptional regulator [Labedaea sp.]
MSRHDRVHGTQRQRSAQTAPDGFFPEVGVVSRPAKAVCLMCPVHVACVAYALEHGELHHGVWGGLSPRERRALLRARAGEVAA